MFQSIFKVFNTINLLHLDFLGKTDKLSYGEERDSSEVLYNNWTLHVQMSVSNPARIGAN